MTGAKNKNIVTGLGPVVLLIDADEAARDLMQRTLLQAGLTVLCCEALQGAAGAAAVLELRTEINVVLLDPLTPSHTASAPLFDFYRQLAAAQRGIQLILLGDPRLSETLAEPWQREATDFLPKPILRRTLLHAVLEAHRRHLAWLGRFGLPSSQQALPGAELRTLQVLTELDEYRARSFGGLVEIDPAWFMLTELLRTRLLGRRISVTSLCLASKSPITTALRRIDKLRRAGLVTYVPDPSDGRRKHIDLTAEGIVRVQEVVQAIARQLRGENATVREPQRP